MKINLEDENLKGSLTGLVVALVEIIREVLEHQALRRMEHDSLSTDEIERLGGALLKLKETIDDLKEDQGIEQAVRDIRGQLDHLVDGTLFSGDHL